MSHEGFNFNPRYQMNTVYNLSITTPPVTSSVELRFEHFMVGLDNVRTCETQESQTDPTKDLFSVYDGNNKLYSCGGGIRWGSRARMTFNLTSTRNRLRFLLNARSTSTTSYHGFLIEYHSKWTKLSKCPILVYDIVLSNKMLHGSMVSEWKQRFNIKDRRKSTYFGWKLSSI